jgi:hypothetical protein
MQAAQTDREAERQAESSGQTGVCSGNADDQVRNECEI